MLITHPKQTARQWQDQGAVLWTPKLRGLWSEMVGSQRGKIELRGWSTSLLRIALKSH